MCRFPLSFAPKKKDAQSSLFVSSSSSLSTKMNIVFDLFFGSIPTGAIAMYGGEYSKLEFQDWLSCQGQVLTSDVYGNLYNVIQYRFQNSDFKKEEEERGCGKGGCSYSFTLPDMDGRYPKSGLNNDGVGYLGGNDEQYFYEYLLPPHTHYAVGCNDNADLSTPTPTSHFASANSNVTF